MKSSPDFFASISIEGFEIPKLFTYPFNYIVHPLAEKAAKELQIYIDKEIRSQHDFEELGKMFGVLVVQNTAGELGYLSAFSGKLGKKNDYERFVPPVYDMLAAEGFYREGEQAIHVVTNEVNALESDPDFVQIQNQFKEETKQSITELAEFKQKQKEAKAIRNQGRIDAENLSDEEKIIIIKALDRESSILHYGWKDLVKKWKERLDFLAIELAKFTDIISEKKKLRRSMSLALQNKLFDNYRFINANKKYKSVRELFFVTDDELPPSGAGECAAPKLLHYAYLHDLKPIALAEFWWGKSPNSEVRKHGYFYPSCRSKCLPILSHMLQGLDVDPNPLADNPHKMDELEIVYEDDSVIVVNKPQDFLSVPGRSITDSIFTRVKKHLPKLRELMTVHRLDMSTSGLMLICKTKQAHKHIQLQFLHRTIKKRYVAILDGIIENESGTIDLPLRVDVENRPRQLVCFERGKQSVTEWKVIERMDRKTRIYFYPHTGRTHQLRMHASHELGLNIPILGDDLYGKRENRLYLHAEGLTFRHPVTEVEIELEVKADF